MGFVGPFSVLVFALIACGGAPKKTGSPTDFKTFEVLQKRLFVGSGARVEVVELKGGEALMRITGSREMLDGKVLRAKANFGKGSRVPGYSALVRGRSLTLLQRVSRGDNVRWLYLGLNYRGWTHLNLAESAVLAEIAKVDPAALRQEYQRQHASGALAFQEYKRAWWLKELDKRMNSELPTLKRHCGAEVPVKVEWKGIDDATLRKHFRNLSSACRSVHSDLERLCRFGEEPAMALVKSLEAIQCNPLGGESVKLEGKTLHYEHRSKGARGVRRPDLLQLKLSPQQTLGEAIAIAASDVCLQGERRVVMRRKSHEDRRKLAYGKQGRFIDHGKLGTRKCWHFFDPRHVEVKNGTLLRNACVAVDRKAKTCTLRCGARKKTLKLANDKTKAETLASAKYELSQLTRVPHALARDRRGTYYYVDRSQARSGGRDFRVYIGRRGRMRAQKMVDVVSDSEGEIFETKRGKLRLILRKAEGLWMAKKQRRKLLLVPVKKNLPLIYRELGVYWGKRLGTPCDDF